MREAQLTRVQRDPAMPVLGLEQGRRPILAVPHDRQSSSGKLNAQLMTAAGGWAQLELAQPPSAFHDAIVQPGHLPCLGWLIEQANAVESPVLLQDVIPLALGQLRLSLDDGPVGLGNLAGSELVRETACRLARAGQQEDARRGTVQSVDQPDIDVSRLLIARLQVVTGPRDQTRVSRRVSLGEQSRGLVDDQAMVVFVKNINLHCPGSATSMIRLTRIVAYDPFPSSNAIFSACRPACNSSANSENSRFSGDTSGSRVPLERKTSLRWRTRRSFQES